MDQQLNRVVRWLGHGHDQADPPMRSRRSFLGRAALVGMALTGSMTLGRATAQATAGYSCDGCGTCRRIDTYYDPDGNRFCVPTLYPCISQSGTCVGKSACAWEQAYNC